MRAQIKIYNGTEWEPYELDADRVIETGSGKGWTFQKWASGKIELWGKFGVASGADGWGYVTATYPTGVQVYGGTTTGSAWSSGHREAHVGFVSTTDNNVGVYVSTGAPNRGSGSASVDLHTIGRWKPEE